jgi:DMSO/TMAO reductase YedYZ molybdopterin-dependent catalytic subunit
MRLAAAGLSSALVPLLAGCAKKIGQQRGTRHFPTPDAPYTPPSDWYFQSVQGAYEADLASYHLKVGGVADDELALGVPEMRAMFEPLVQPVTVACVGNAPNGALMSGSWFRGVRVRDVLERAGVSSRASGAFITGLDGFVAYQTLDELVRPESMLAFDVGTSPEALVPLPVDNGFPCRILTPGSYGYIQPKWIDTIALVDQGGHHSVLSKSIPYFEGKIQLASGFSRPRSGTYPPGELDLYGYAYGDGRRDIAKVELGIDGGAWRRAELVWNLRDDELPRYLWLLWRFRWDAPPGDHTLRVRATYDDGETQIAGMKFPYSAGSIAEMTLSIRPGAAELDGAGGETGAP